MIGIYDVIKTYIIYLSDIIFHNKVLINQWNLY